MNVEVCSTTKSSSFNFLAGLLKEGIEKKTTAALASFFNITLFETYHLDRITSLRGKKKPFNNFGVYLLFNPCSMNEKLMLYCHGHAITFQALAELPKYVMLKKICLLLSFKL